MAQYDSHNQPYDGSDNTSLQWRQISYQPVDASHPCGPTGDPVINEGRTSHFFDPARSALEESTHTVSQPNCYRQILSPAISPRSLYSKVDPPSTTAKETFRDPLERSLPSPCRNPIKRELSLDNQNPLNPPPDPTVQTQSEGTVALSSVSSVSSEGTSNPLNSFPPSSFPSFRAAFPGTLDQQRELFRALERICTVAAATYWRSQRRAVIDERCHVARAAHHFVLTRGLMTPTNRRYHPYAHGAETGFRECSLGLTDYVLRIAHLLWDRATRLSEHSEELEAVHRMGNLYSWGRKVADAAAGNFEEGAAGHDPMWALREEAVMEVMMAGRDLAAWLLNEHAKREIDELLERRWILVRDGGR